MTKREPGLDLLRCLALLGVVSFHFFLYNGYYHEPQAGLWMWLAGSARTLSIGCIGLFLMLTGYLGCAATGLKAGWKALPPVLLGYLLAAVVSIPVRHFAFGETATLQDWLSRLFSFSALYYGWYVEMFVGLTLLRPFLNRLLQALDDRGLLSFAAVLLVVTALPGTTPLPLAPDYWYKLYPITYYVLGAAVRRLQPRISMWVGLGIALFVAFTLGAATVLSTDGPLEKAFAPQYGDLWIVLLVLGAPIWLSLLIAVAAAAIAVYVSCWAVIISVWAVFVSVAACGIYGMAVGLGFAMGGNVTSGLAMIGGGLFCAGVSILLFYGCKSVTVGTLRLTGKLALWCKSRFIGRRDLQ